MNIGDIVKVKWIDITYVKQCEHDRIPSLAHCTSYGRVVQMDPFLCIEKEDMEVDCDRQSFPPGCVLDVEILKEVRFDA